MKVTIRKKPLTKHRHRLFLDYYPALLDPKTSKKSRFENLKLYIYDNPVGPTQKEHNKDTIKLAETIRAKRQLDIQVQLHGLIPNYKRLESFHIYFRLLANRQRGTNRHNWDSSVRHFQLFATKDVRFIDLNLNLCEDYKMFLLKEPKLREARKGIGHNTALSYFNKFRAALKQAWREKLIDEDLHGQCSGLKENEAEIEYLTMNEISQLIKTPTDDDLSKRVVLFSILTGLRFCDIRYLRWGQVRGENGAYYLQFRQLKTYKPQHVFISNQAHKLLGDCQDAESYVFGKVYYNQVRNFLVQWPMQAGIVKHLTFSCLRHTYATLQLDLGTDIYTISKLLGHRHLKTTQRYTRVMDRAKKEAANRIILDL